MLTEKQRKIEEMGHMMYGVMIVFFQLVVLGYKMLVALQL